MNSLTASMYGTLLGYGPGGSRGASSNLANQVALGTPLNVLANIAQTRANGYSRQIGADQAKMAGLKQLQSAVSAFQSAMAAIETQAAVSPAQVTSSNAAVATGSATPTAALGSYAVNVTQLAAAQSVTSAAFADPNLTAVGTGTLTIQLGTYNAGANTFTAGASAPVTVNVTNGSLNGIASAINAVNAGVTASVTQDAAGFHLTLASAATGAANGFQVSVADADGTNTDIAGLSQLSYIPTAAAGTGKNLTQTQAAQDAAYSINGIAGTSAGNTNIAGGPGLIVSLSQVGSANLTVGLSYNTLQASVQSFVKAFNTAVTAVRGLSAPGGAAASDRIATAFVAGLEGGIYKNFASATPYTNLAQIGVTAKTDGTFSLDTAALQAAFNANPAAVVSLVTQAAQDFDAATTPYIQTAGTIPSALQKLQSDLTFLQSQSAGATQTDATITQVQATLRYQLAMQLSRGGLFSQLFNTGGNGAGNSPFF